MCIVICSNAAGVRLALCWCEFCPCDRLGFGHGASEACGEYTYVGFVKKAGCVDLNLF